jgi:hypothetical protein
MYTHTPTHILSNASNYIYKLQKVYKCMITFRGFLKDFNKVFSAATQVSMNDYHLWFSRYARRLDH